MAQPYSEQFLDDLRRALPVLDLIGRTHKLRKEGREYRAIDDNSLTVSPEKNIWHDFANGKGGDIFNWEMHQAGCTFVDAVAHLAAIAGIRDPNERQVHRPPASGPAGPEPPPLEHPPGGNGYASNKREITATYDYTDPDGGMVYQVVRFEWFEAGKRKKSFSQRRPVDGRWAWGLSAGPYLRSKANGELYTASKDRLAKWLDAESVHLEDVAHTLYQLPQLREEMLADPDERRTIFITEGEKDVHTLAGWGLLATTNSGGAKNWRPYHADEFRDADAVILLDNDKAGRERGHAIAASLRPIAKRVRVLSWPDHWTAAFDGADVTDWRDHAGGNRDKLLALLDRLPTWVPEVPESAFGATRFVDIDKKARELEWLIKMVLTRGELSIWYGAWSCGKSFLLTDAALAIARGTPWMGLRTRPGLVIYQAGEGGLGFKKRLRAYRQENFIPHDDDLPFVLLTGRIDIFNGDEDANRLIAEIKAWQAFYDTPLELVVIDTFNAASPGADENASRDMGPVINRARRISNETGAHVALVDHTPKDGGSPRGWSGKMGNIDNAIAIAATERKHIGDDGRTRQVREWRVAKQKDESSDVKREFVLRAVVVGKDLDGDPLTSCVVMPITTGQTGERRDVIPEGWAQIKPANEDIMRCLMQALHKHGRPAPAGIAAPPGKLVVTIAEWQAALLELSVGHEEITAALRERIRKKIYRAAVAWLPDKVNFINKDREWVWRTDRKIHMIDRLPPVKKAPEPILAPGETADQMDFSERF